MKRINTFAFVLAVALASAGFTMLLTVNLSESWAKQKVDGELVEELKVFTDVLSLVQEHYVKEVSGKDLAAGAIKGVMSALDPHSAYLDATYFEDLQAQTKGEFGGLGIELAMKEGMLVVVAPMEDTPAERAGVRAGDVIVKVEGEYIRDVSLMDVVKKLRGPRGTAVHISVMRRGGSQKLHEIRIVRDKIQIKSVKAHYLGDGYGYVRISQFMETTGLDLELALRKFHKRVPELRGLVLDLRNNPGGLLSQAIKVSDFFLREGVIVYTKGRSKAQEQRFFAHGAETEPDYPIVVLVNGGSASASEIVAGALKDHGRALILGQQTFGKGSVQTINPLNNGGAVQLTTALYYTKSGRSIQAQGVLPDILMAEEVEEEPRESNAAASKLPTIREADLPGAFKNPLATEKASQQSPSVVENMVKKLSLDEQLQQDLYVKRALELLKTFDIFGRIEGQEGEVGVQTE